MDPSLIPTRPSASSTLLPTSLLEAQVLLAGIQSKFTLPLFFESPVFQRLLEGDYSSPLLDSQNTPDYDGSSPFPAFHYPRALVPFCFPPETSRPLSVASGLDLFCSAQMAVRTLQVLFEDLAPTESEEIYNVFEEVAPFLGSKNHFPFCCLQNDLFSPPATKAPVVPPRALRRKREIESLKADASTLFSSPCPIHSRDLDNDKASAVKIGSKSKATVKVVEDSKVSDPPSPAMVYKRVQLPPHLRKIVPTTSKGKSRQVIVTDDNSASSKVESEDEDEEEAAAPPPKGLKTISSISASLPHCSVKRVSIPKQ
ncbi:hypothetical protein EV368DRAFT_90115 [Lentinula lateritia]|nr:hypothetical protein EV368DRAFT_90115 [Lentinula lateritia]